MLTKNINFHNFLCKKKNNVKNIFNEIKKNYFLGKEKLLLSLSDQYKYSFDLKKISKLKKFSIYRIIKLIHSYYYFFIGLHLHAINYLAKYN